MTTSSAHGVIQWRSTNVIDVRLEQVVGADEFQNPWFLSKGARISRPVGLIPNLATAFLIGPSYIMTNWHVFRRVDWARKKKVLFNFEQDEDGVPSPYTEFRLQPNEFFYSNEALDFAVVKTEGTPGITQGYIDISQPAEPSLETRVNIVQHPGAGFKKIAVRSNGLKFFDTEILQYWTDTEHGSSGSPLFDDRWNIIGLHYLQDAAPGPDGKIYYNQGHRMAAIQERLFTENPGLILVP